MPQSVPRHMHDPVAHSSPEGRLRRTHSLAVRSQGCGKTTVVAEILKSRRGYESVSHGTWFGAKMEWVIERPGFSDSPRTRSSPRRSHTKSRTGCLPCKNRRIKCDESRPECGQCTTRKAKCIYPSLGASESRTTMTADAPASTPALPAPAPAPVPATAQLAGYAFLLEKNAEECPKSLIMAYLDGEYLPGRNPNYRRDDIPELLDHFSDHGENWIGPPECQEIMQAHGLKLAVDAPYLLHAIIAFSATHMQFCRSEVGSYDVVATFHYAVSLKTFATQLGTSVTAENADALFASCFLHSMLAFGRKSHNRLDEQPAICDKMQFGWLRSIRGVPTLQATKSIQQNLSQSLWYPVFQKSGGLRPSAATLEATEDSNSAAKDTVEKLERLCAVSIDQDPSVSPYIEPLRHLNGLLRMDPDVRKIGPSMVFIGKLPPRFVDLLERGDTQAMLILTYWLSLMSQIRQWWTESQARDECRRLCGFLASSDDIQVQDLLRFPAQQCGFTG